MRFIVLTAVVLCLAGLSSGCSGSGDCKKVVDHISAVALQGMPEELRADRVSEFEAAKPEMIKKCKQDGLSKKQEACALAASSLEELGACNR